MIPDSKASSRCQIWRVQVQTKRNLTMQVDECSGDCEKANSFLFRLVIQGSRFVLGMSFWRTCFKV